MNGSPDVAKVDLPYLQVVKARGKLYAYYRRDGRRVPIKDEAGQILGPQAAGFLAAYQRIHDGYNTRPAEPGILPGTFADLVVAFKASPDWKALKPATRTSYARYLDALRAKHGAKRVATMPREWVLKVRDDMADTPRKADYVVSVLRRILQWALDRPARFGLKHNPADKITRIAKADGYKAWPAALIAHVLADASAPVALAVRLGLDTGQRIGDCIAMRWTQYQAGTVELVQQKTGERLVIPATPELKAALATAPRSAVTVLCTAGGRPWNRHALAREIKEAVEAAGFIGYSFHGLRKNAAVRLAEVGCTDGEIMAITGHRTRAMVDLYTREANQKRMAKSAITRLSRKRPENTECKTRRAESVKQPKA